jgi:uracil-DNA glycosylase family 4
VLVLAAPTSWEDDENKPLVCAEGLLLKSLLKGMGYAPGSYNVVYAVGCNGDEVVDEHVVACRKYLRYKLEQLQPSVILSFGGDCGYALTGERYDEKSVRKGFRWLGINGTPTKVCLLMSETDLVANSTKVNPMKEDLRWALNTKNMHKQYSYVSVQDEHDSDDALNAAAHSHYTAFDIEASGTQHDNDYRITCIAFWPAAITWAA